jgi:NodT family efflux transporter outer membrane factor (OMF) lipoprotein
MGASIDERCCDAYKANVRSLNVNAPQVKNVIMRRFAAHQIPNRNLRSGAAVAALLAGATLASGCALMPRERPTPPPVPNAWTEADTAAAPVSLTDWWKGFSDPTLDQLVAEGLERSPTVRQAVLRVREARAQGRQTLTAYLPEIDGTGRGQYTRSIQGPGLLGSTLSGVGGGGAFTPEQEQAIGSYGATASWEIPLLARLTAAVTGARANTRAAIEDVRGAKVTLVADIASAYVDLRTAQNRRDALRRGAELAVSLADILQKSADAGITAPADAADARRQAESTKAALADIEIATRQAANQLALLRAHAPGTEAPDVAAVLDERAPVPTIALAAAPAAPADLVRLRPDIARAEAQAIVAAAEVGLSRSDLLPRLALTGSLLASDNLIGNALSQPVTQAQVIPTVTIPLLDWGKRFAAIDQNKARFQEALISYEATVNQGVAEASAALTELTQGEQRLAAARAAEAAAAATAKGRRASFDAGITSLTDRLRADQQLLDAEQQRIQAESSAAKAAIDVYRAFGGGPPDIAKK